MTYRPSKGVLLCSGVLLLLLLVLFPLYPIATVSFEAGLIVGLFLHSSHTAHGLENGMIEEGEMETIEKLK